jgi:hypothetical protein
MPNTLPLFVILLPILFFYLRGFHPSGECLCVALKLQMPRAFAVAPFGVAPVIEVTTTDIRLNRMPMGEIAELGRTKAPIVRMLDDLTTLKNNYALMHPITSFPGRVLLSADRDTPFWVIERVRETALLAGYPDTQYIVEDANAEDD